MRIGIKIHTSKFLPVKITCNRDICPVLADLTDLPHAWNDLRKYLRGIYAANITHDIVEVGPLEYIGKLKTKNPNGR